ncbi:hypothetical protein [Halosegnis marinus]|uniref:Uncharacterized protein n=1 Tax=Halosegnis marinus TaxID=3034023 RepID=A0ABD5ZQZ8_9EURY|nr:hypothetical protein [Halosegnis sp. DT85]
MIDEEGRLRALVTRLGREYREQTGFFARHTLPEYEAMRSLDLTPRERALFVTLSVVPFHTHPSGDPKREVGRGGLWQVCATLRRQHPWTFDPGEIADDGESRLVRLFDNLEAMDEYDARWWHTCAATVHEEFDGDPRTLFARHDYVAPHVARDVRRYALPGIGDVVTTPFWLRTVHDQVRELGGTRWLRMPVDYTLFRVTRKLGGLDLAYRDRDDRDLVADFWTVFCRKHGLVPMAVEKPLRLVGLHWDREGKAHVAETLDRL